MAAQMITAQKLSDGASVYMTEDSAWSDSFAQGALYGDDDAATRALAQAQESVARQIVVGPYLIDVEVDDKGPRPTSTRERIRATHDVTIAIDQGSWTSWIAG
jgi:Protein of unknown function (DUF2849)